jgi:hypothetical protein
MKSISKIVVKQKNVDSLKMYIVYLKVLRLWMIFEMVNGLEMHVIYCMIIVEIIII